jgi:hypothetical protein
MADSTPQVSAGVQAAVDAANAGEYDRAFKSDAHVGNLV